METYDVEASGVGAAKVEPCSISTFSGCWGLPSVVAAEVVVWAAVEPSYGNSRANVLGIGGGYIL